MSVNGCCATTDGLTSAASHASLAVSSPHNRAYVAPTFLDRTSALRPSVVVWPRSTAPLRLRLADFVDGYRGLLILPPRFSPGMSSSKSLVLPTAIRHSTLVSSSPRYRYRSHCLCHKLLAFAIIALLALTVAPVNAADIPPRHRQYKYTRTLAHENVNRAPPAHLHQAFDVVRIYVPVTTLWSLTATLHPYQRVAFS